MATPKARTLQQRFGFRDSDLRTPKHDEMMLWLHENMAQFLTNGGLWHPAEYTIADMNRQKEDARKRSVMYDAQDIKAFASLEFSNLPPLPENRDDFNIKWEAPIISGRNKYIIGFIDMIVRFKSNWSYQYFSGGWHAIGWDNVIYIELKTKIPSLGELIRQIRMYQTHAKESGKWLVVCPDDRFKEPLASQGITLIKYTGDVTQKRLI